MIMLKIEVKIAKIPKSSGTKSRVKIGTMIKGIPCAIKLALATLIKFWRNLDSFFALDILKILTRTEPASVINSLNLVICPSNLILFLVNST